MLRVTTITLCLLGAVLAAPGFVWAEDCPRAGSPEEARTLAGQAFTEGQEQFEAGNYRVALTRFECSYDLVPHSNTLYNMGECAEALGEVDTAIRYFRTYLEEYPDAEGVTEIRTRLSALEARQEEPPPPPPPPGDSGGDDGDATRMTLARRLAWITLGVGAGIAIIGGGVYGGAVAQNGDFDRLNQEYLEGDDQLDGNELQELEDIRGTGEAMEAAGWALMGVGLASLAASIVLFAAFEGSESTGSASREGRNIGLSVSPLVLDEGGGLFIAGAF